MASLVQTTSGLVCQLISSVREADLNLYNAGDCFASSVH